MNIKIRPRISQYVYFGLLQLAIILTFAIPAFRDDFRGGGFLTALLAILVVTQVICIVRDSMLAGKPASERESVVEPGIDYVKAAAGIITSLMGFLLLIYLLGMYVGIPIFCFVYWRLALRLSLWKTVFLSLIFGFIAPLSFSWMLSITLWTGVIPEIIPGMLGGSVTPPF